jgi:hypothetical protein
MVGKQEDFAVIDQALEICEKHFKAVSYAQANVDDAQRDTFRKLAVINAAQTALNRLRNDR